MIVDVASIVNAFIRETLGMVNSISKCNSAVGC